MLSSRRTVSIVPSLAGMEVRGPLIWLRALFLLLSFALPGWGLVSALRPRLRREEVPFVLMASGAGLNALLAMGLGLAGIFSLWNHLLGMGCLSALLLWVGRGRIRWPLEAGGQAWLISLMVVLVALAASLPPGRTVFGWSDVGVYPCIAAYLQREGSIHMEVPTVCEVSSERRDLVYSFQGTRGRPFLAYENKAYFITDFERGKVVPQFYYLWPSFLAFFAAFLGRQSLFFGVTAAAVLSLWGFFLLSRRILGERMGLAVTTLLALNPLFAYFSKYTTSEMMNFFLLMAAAMTACAYLEVTERKGNRKVGDGIREALLSAFFVLLCFLCRVDFILFIPPLLLFMLARWVSGKFCRADAAYLCCSLAALGFSTLVGWGFSRPYVHELWLSFRGHLLTLATPWGLLSALALLAAAVVARALFKRSSKGLSPRALRALGRWVPLLLWASAASIFLYLYAVRPERPSPEAWYGVISAARGPSYKNQAFLRWGWYFSTLGLVLIYAGFAAWLSRRRPAGSLFCGLVGLAFVLFYSYDLHCTPIHMLTMRRLVPAALPFSLLALGMALKELMIWSSRIFRGLSRPRLPGKVTAGAVMFYLMLYSFHAGLPAVGLSEGGNQLELCREVAEETGAGSVVLLDYHLGDLFGPPLRSFYGVENAWLMDNSFMVEGDFRGLLEDLGWEGREVYLLWRPNMSGPIPPQAVEVRVERVGSWLSQELMVEKTFDRRPSRRTLYSYTVELYRLIPATAPKGRPQ